MESPTIPKMTGRMSAQSFDVSYRKGTLRTYGYGGPSLVVTGRHRQHGGGHLVPDRDSPASS